MDPAVKQLGAILLAIAVILGLVALWNNVIKDIVEDRITDEIDGISTSYVMPSEELPNVFVI